MNVEYDLTSVEEGDVIEDENGEEYIAIKVDKSANNERVIWGPKE